jgi:hypothetical protein
MNLKNLIREVHDTATLFPSDIFNLYFLEYLHSSAPQLFSTDYGEFILKTYTDALRKKYLTVFKHLLADQLKKYVSRKRTDPDFNTSAISSNANASTLHDLMRKTFRSDLKRRNDLWVLVGEYTMRLEQSSGLKDTFTYINMLNNSIHNTGTKILEKVDFKLLHALDIVAKAKSIGEYEKFVDKDLRQLRSQGG